MVGNCSRACVEGRLSFGEGEEEGEDRSQDAANCPNPSPLSSPLFLRGEARNTGINHPFQKGVFLPATQICLNLEPIPEYRDIVWLERSRTL